MSPVVRAWWIADGEIRTGDVDSLPLSGAGPVWIDVTDPDEAVFAVLGERFWLPPLAVEDCLHFPQRPKYDVYPDVAFAIWLRPHLVTDDGLASQELDVFLGKDHLITVHAGRFEPLERVAGHAASHLARGVEWTLHAVLDVCVDDVFPLVDAVVDELEQLEDLMLEDARQEHLARLFTAKRTLVALHKIVGPERDVVRGLARQEAFVEPDAYMYFQDVGDHLARVADSIDTYREVANGTMDIYLSSQSNRMNQIMKQLTVVATIFMPLTLISGIYGMNVTVGMWPPVRAAWSFGLIIAAMVMLSVWMVVFFRRKNWW